MIKFIVLLLIVQIVFAARIPFGKWETQDVLFNGQNGANVNPESNANSINIGWGLTNGEITYVNDPSPLIPGGNVIKVESGATHGHGGARFILETPTTQDTRFGAWFFFEGQNNFHLQVQTQDSTWSTANSGLTIEPTLNEWTWIDVAIPTTDLKAIVLTIGGVDEETAVTWYMDYVSVAPATSVHTLSKSDVMLFNGTEPNQFEAGDWQVGCWAPTSCDAPTSINYNDAGVMSYTYSASSEEMQLWAPNVMRVGTVVTFELYTDAAIGDVTFKIKDAAWAQIASVNNKMSGTWENITLTCPGDCKDLAFSVANIVAGTTKISIDKLRVQNGFNADEFVYVAGDQGPAINNVASSWDATAEFDATHGYMGRPRSLKVVYTQGDRELKMDNAYNGDRYEMNLPTAKLYFSAYADTADLGLILRVGNTSGNWEQDQQFGTASISETGKWLHFEVDINVVNAWDLLIFKGAGTSDDGGMTLFLDNIYVKYERPGAPEAEPVKTIEYLFDITGSGTVDGFTDSNVDWSLGCYAPDESYNNICTDVQTGLDLASTEQVHAPSTGSLKYAFTLEGQEFQFYSGSKVIVAGSKFSFWMYTTNAIGDVAIQSKKGADGGYAVGDIISNKATLEWEFIEIKVTDTVQDFGIKPNTIGATIYIADVQFHEAFPQGAVMLYANGAQSGVSSYGYWETTADAENVEQTLVGKSMSLKITFAQGNRMFKLNLGTDILTGGTVYFSVYATASTSIYMRVSRGDHGASEIIGQALPATNEWTDYSVQVNAETWDQLIFQGALEGTDPGMDVWFDNVYIVLAAPLPPSNKGRIADIFEAGKGLSSNAQLYPVFVPTSVVLYDNDTNAFSGGDWQIGCYAPSGCTPSVTFDVWNENRTADTRAFSYNFTSDGEEMQWWSPGEMGAQTSVTFDMYSWQSVGDIVASWKDTGYQVIASNSSTVQDAWETITVTCPSPCKDFSVKPNAVGIGSEVVSFMNVVLKEGPSLQEIVFTINQSIVDDEQIAPRIDAKALILGPYLQSIEISLSSDSPVNVVVKYLLDGVQVGAETGFDVTDTASTWEGTAQEVSFNQIKFVSNATTNLTITDVKVGEAVPPIPEGENIVEIFSDELNTALWNDWSWKYTFEVEAGDDRVVQSEKYAYMKGTYDADYAGGEMQQKLKYTKGFLFEDSEVVMWAVSPTTVDVVLDVAVTGSPDTVVDSVGYQLVAGVWTKLTLKASGKFNLIRVGCLVNSAVIYFDAMHVVSVPRNPNFIIFGDSLNNAFTEVSLQTEVNVEVSSTYVMEGEMSLKVQFFDQPYERFTVLRSVAHQPELFFGTSVAYSMYFPDVALADYTLKVSTTLYNTETKENAKVCETTVKDQVLGQWNQFTIECEEEFDGISFSYANAGSLAIYIDKIELVKGANARTILWGGPRGEPSPLLTTDDYSWELVGGSHTVSDDVLYNDMPTNKFSIKTASWGARAWRFEPTTIPDLTCSNFGLAIFIPRGSGEINLVLHLAEDAGQKVRTKKLELELGVWNEVLIQTKSQGFHRIHLQIGGQEHNTTAPIYVANLWMEKQYDTLCTPQPADSTNSLTNLTVVDGMLVNGTGQVQRIIGAYIPGSEKACIAETSEWKEGDPRGYGVFDLKPDQDSINHIKWDLGANTIRLPLNSHCLLGLSNVKSDFALDKYLNEMELVISRLSENGLLTIISLEYDGPVGASFPVPDATFVYPVAANDTAPDFWKQVAARFKDNDLVAFNLFSQPFVGDSTPTADDWECYLNGTSCSGLNVDGTPLDYAVVGINELISVVRGEGFSGLIIVDGLQHGTDLSGIVVNDPMMNVALGYQFTEDHACTEQSCMETLVSESESDVVIIEALSQEGCTFDKTMPFLRYIDENSNISVIASNYGSGDCSGLLETNEVWSIQGLFIRNYFRKMLGLSYDASAFILPTAAPTNKPVGSSSAEPETGVPTGITYTNSAKSVSFYMVVVLAVLSVLF